MRRLFIALFAVALAFPAAASDKFTVHDDRPMDDARRPAPGKALIYFVRTQTMGFALIMSKPYVPVEVDPGKHEFVVEAANAGFLEADVTPDRVYVVQVAIHMGAMKARTHFEVARTLTTTDEGLNWVKEDASKIQEVIKKYRDKGEEFEHLKPEDGFAGPPWKKQGVAQVIAVRSGSDRSP
ncbi:MAG TPA: hypothetical protein VEW47_11300 [Candidatus Dormibacteraeota bacterium]|nr:hypothetical protein [Candidatus Dormibacteraeota bacterium]